MSVYHALLGYRWQRTRKAYLDKYDWRCERCGRHASEVHHKRPLGRGGAPHDEQNLEALCKGCHVEHHLPKVTGLREWRRHMKGQHA